MTEREPTDYLDITTHIRADGIYFGDDKIPGLIDADGVVLRPGGKDDINRLQVTFLVGPVVCHDAMVSSKTIGTQTEPATQYSSKGKAEPPLLCSSLQPRKHALSTPRLCELERHHDGPHQTGNVKWVDVELPDDAGTKRP